MVKSGPLGNAEKYYLDHEIGKSDVEAMMKFLDRSKGMVEEYVETFRAANPEVLSVASNMAGNGRGSIVMTKGAAELISEFRGRQGVRPECVSEIKKK